MCNAENGFVFQVGENRVFDRDLEGLLGKIRCSFADVMTVAYILKSKGYTISAICSDGFCVVLRDEKEVSEVVGHMGRLNQYLALAGGEDSQKFRDFHKMAAKIHLSALHKACIDTWKVMFPEVQEEDVRFCKAQERDYWFHFSAALLDKEG